MHPACEKSRQDMESALQNSWSIMVERKGGEIVCCNSLGLCYSGRTGPWMLQENRQMSAEYMMMTAMH